MHDPRFEPALGVIYKMYPGKHIQALQFCSPVDFTDYAPLGYGAERDDIERRAQQIVRLEYICHMVNMTGSCAFGYLATTPDSLGSFLKAVTGQDWPYERIFEVGARISSLRQVYNLLEGINLVKNEIPGRIIGDPPLKAGPTSEFTVSMNEMMDIYLKHLGWSKDGIPQRDLLNSLGLGFAAGDLASNSLM